MKSQLSTLIVLVLVVAGGRASALNTFECVRDLLSITELSSLQLERRNVEKPFIVEGGFMVFPEVSKEKVIGFYVYKNDQAWHYDSYEIAGSKSRRAKKVPLASVRAPQSSIYQLVTQPDGIQTLTLQFLPGFLGEKSSDQAPVALGASVMPVIGAFVGSTMTPTKWVYYDPASFSEDSIRNWIYERLVRKPASISEIELRKPMVHLTSSTPKEKEALFRPLVEEYRLRKHWIQNNNLADAPFRDLTRLMQGSCKE